MEITYDFIVFILAMIATWAMYLQLYGKSNPFYSWAQATYMGTAFGLDLVVMLLFIYYSGFLPFIQGDWSMSLGLILGALTLLKLSTKYAWVSRIPLSIAIGNGLGLALRTQIFSNFLYQIRSLILPLFKPGDLFASINNTTVILATLFMLTYFTYTYTQTGALGKSARVGESVLYIGLGAYFASIFMGRLGLLIGYMQEITTPSWKIPYSIGIGILLLMIVFVMDKYQLLEKYSD